MPPLIKSVGDAAIEVIFGDRIDIDINRKVHSFDNLLCVTNQKGLLETVPSYCSLLINYDPLIFSYNEIVEFARKKLDQVELIQQSATHLLEIPVYYGGKNGPDLGFVADCHNMYIEEVIYLHSSINYQVFMMGFTPGFPYLGGLNPKLATPRLETPRAHVPAGSVGIAGDQTGIYPVDSPGGWRIIGFTPLRLFNPQNEPHFLFRPGDTVRFVPASEDTYRNVT